ncbi:MAG: YqaJ viral recombinase family protein [Methylomicrobium sp.]|nr:YqaJ viral recombinase family protein [Methylomicrobium sp.]
MNLFDQFDAELGEQTQAATLTNAAEGKPIKTQEDREREWLQQRWGKFTASEVHKLMTYPNKDELPKGAMTYIMKVVAETLTEFHIDTFSSSAMECGKLREPEAVDAFQAATGLDVSKCKDDQEFIDRGHVGGTPDGLILSEFSGIEIKCPNSNTHINYLHIKTGADLKAEAPDYYWQIHCLMMLTASLHWYFVSYDPRFKSKKHHLHIAKIAADPGDIGALRRRLALAEAYKQKIIVDLK